MICFTSNQTTTLKLYIYLRGIFATNSLFFIFLCQFIFKKILLNFRRRKFIFYFVDSFLRGTLFIKLKWIKCCTLTYNPPSGSSNRITKCDARRVFACSPGVKMYPPFWNVDPLLAPWKSYLPPSSPCNITCQGR